MPKLYPILDTKALETRNISLLEAAAAILSGGARLIQIRHKQHWSRQVFAEASEVADLCAKHGAQMIVNDRADFAMLLDAGLHLGQDDLAPSEARKLIGSDRTLGFSTHDSEQLIKAASEPVDYVALGPIFGTTNKDNPDPAVGLENLTAWRKLTSRNLVAIGGITRSNALSVLAAGADSVAVIGDLLPETGSDYGLRERFDLWRRLLNM